MYKMIAFGKKKCIKVINKKNSEIINRSVVECGKEMTCVRHGKMY